MTSLRQLTEEDLLKNIQVRYFKDKIYVWEKPPFSLFFSLFSFIKFSLPGNLQPQQTPHTGP